MTTKRKRRGQTLEARWTLAEIRAAVDVVESWTPGANFGFDAEGRMLLPTRGVPKELLRAILLMQCATEPRNPGGQPGRRRPKGAVADMLAYAESLQVDDRAIR